MVEEKKELKKELKKNECFEAKKELSLQELEQVNGEMITCATVQIKGDDIAILNITEATSELQGKAVGVVATPLEGQPGAKMCFRVR